MKIGKLTAGDKTIVASAVALIVFSFLPWFGFEHEFSRNGWHYPLFGIVPIVLALAMVAAVFVVRLATLAPGVTGRMRAALGAGCCVAPLLILFKFVVGDKVNAVINTVSLERKVGLYTSLAAAIGLAVGGLLEMKDRRVRS